MPVFDYCWQKFIAINGDFYVQSDFLVKTCFIQLHIYQPLCYEQDATQRQFLSKVLLDRIQSFHTQSKEPSLF